MKIILAIMLSLSLVGVFLPPLRLDEAQTASVVNISFFGSASSGWGFTQNSMTSPGPTITVNIGDLVNLTLTSVDGFPHKFFVDYNGDGNPSSGEPTSTTFTGTVNYQFNATTAGTFAYFCQFHPGVMHGFVIVEQPTVNAIPPEITQYAKDWPLPNRDYGNTRFTTDATISSSNVGNLKLAWSFRIPGVGAYGGGASNPIIMGDSIYFQDLKANVFSLNLQDGHVNWQKIYNISAVVGPNGPAVGWGKVFVAKDLYTIAALNASTGQEIWATKISNVNTTGIDIQPSIYDNMVYVSTVPGTADVFYAAGGIGVIYALDQITGSMMWNFSTVDAPGLWGHPEVNSGGGCWYTPAIDVNTGVTYWGIANPAPFPGTAAWPNGSSRPGPDLYTNSMIALDHKTGTMKWFTQVLPHDLLDHDFQIAPILASANINGTQQDIVIGAGKMGRVYAFNRQTGAILWQTDVGQHQNDTLTALPPGTTRVLPGIFGGVETPMGYSVSNRILYVPVIDLFSDWNSTQFDFSTLDLTKGKGELVAINVSTGNTLWSKMFDSINVGAATVVNDVVFTATNDGTIYGFKDTTGDQLFTYKAPAGINGWPAVVGDTIVWPAGVGINASVIALKVSRPGAGVDNFSLFGSASQGWGFTPSTISSPGPTISATQGDLVNLTLTSQDGLSHRFFVDYNGNGAVDVGEPATPSFTGTINYQFNATVGGTFTYYCAFHPSIMFGTFKVAGSDVAVTNVTCLKTVVGQDAIASVNVTVANHGDFSELFNVTLMALANRTAATTSLTLLGSASTGWNNTVPGPTIAVDLGDTVILNLVSSDSVPHEFFIDYNGDGTPSPGEPTSPTFMGQAVYTFVANQTGTFTYYCAFHPGGMHGTFIVSPDIKVGVQSVSPPLTAGEVRTLVFVWNTAGVVKGNYTFVAIADTVPGEISTADNTFADGSIRVAMLGDITGISGSPDGKVDMRDIAPIARLFEIAYPDPRYVPNADIVYDGRIDFKDISSAARHFAEVDP